jgi:hypothetical protein
VICCLVWIIALLCEDMVSCFDVGLEHGVYIEV